MSARRTGRLLRAGRGRLRRLALLAALTALAPGASAQEMVTKVVPAGFRSAQELADVLAPLVPAPGSVRGYAGKLIIRTTPANLAELEDVLASLDRAPANLLVSVRRTVDEAVRRDLADARARIGGDGLQAGVGAAAGGTARGGAVVGVERGDVSAGVRIRRSVRTGQGDDVQTLRVLEGKEAFIRTGESVPVGERSVVITGAGVSVSDGVRYEEFGSGFYVRPRLNGAVVILDIIPSRRERRGDGSAAVQEASTSVSGVLGRWMEIGGVNSRALRSSGGIGSSRSVTTQRSDAIFVKVDRLD